MDSSSTTDQSVKTKRALMDELCAKIQTFKGAHAYFERQVAQTQAEVAAEKPTMEEKEPERTTLEKELTAQKEANKKLKKYCTMLSDAHALGAAQAQLVAQAKEIEDLKSQLTEKTEQADCLEKSKRDQDHQVQHLEKTLDEVRKSKVSHVTSLKKGLAKAKEALGDFQNSYEQLVKQSDAHKLDYQEILGRQATKQREVEESKAQVDSELEDYKYDNEILGEDLVECQKSKIQVQECVENLSKDKKQLEDDLEWATQAKAQVDLKLKNSLDRVKELTEKFGKAEYSAGMMERANEILKMDLERSRMTQNALEKSQTRMKQEYETLRDILDEAEQSRAKDVEGLNEDNANLHKMYQEKVQTEKELKEELAACQKKAIEDLEDCLDQAQTHFDGLLREKMDESIRLYDQLAAKDRRIAELLHGPHEAGYDFGDF